LADSLPDLTEDSVGTEAQEKVLKTKIIWQDGKSKITATIDESRSKIKESVSALKKPSMTIDEIFDEYAGDKYDSVIKTQDKDSDRYEYTEVRQ